MKLTYRHYLVFLLLAGAALFVHRHEDLAVPANRPLEEIPLRVGPWQMINQGTFDEATLAVLKPSAYLVRTYRNPAGATVGLYLGYHGGGPGSGPIHSPKHCLPGGGWCVVNEKTDNFAIGNDRIALVRAVYQKDRSDTLFLYWYQARSKTFNDEFSLKFSEITNSIMHNRRDTAFIRVTVPVADNLEQAERLGEQFITDFYPAIKAVLPM